MRLDYRDLRALAQVQASGSVTRSGAALGLSQSAVSQALGRLERAIGCAITSKRGRGIQLTAAGQRLAEEATQVVGAMQRATQIAEALARGESEQLRIGLMVAFTHHLFAREIAEFAAAHPDTGCLVASRSKAEIEAGLACGELDLGVLMGQAQAEPLAQMWSSVVCALPPGHPLCARSELHWRDLDGHRQVQLTPGSPLRQILETAGCQPHQRRGVEAATQRAVIAMVEAGAGIGLVDPWVIHASDAVEQRPLQPRVSLQVGLFGAAGWSRNRAAVELVARLQKVMAAA